MSFADLKRKSQSNFDFLQKELEKSASGKQVDERFWKPEVDASGNGYAVIRFLPAPEGETVPWAKVYSHAFQGPGGWYIENSLTTLGEKDPVGEVNRILKTKVRYSFTSTARRSMIRSLLLCNLSSKMRLLSMSLIFGKVPTSN
jgi:hypothetical protein